MRAYHFTSDDTLRDGSPLPPIGEWLEYVGPVEICKSGLHYSKHPVDALQYAPGNWLHLVQVENVVERHKDKGVCRRRKIVATIDATELLYKFARKCALDVYHLWGNDRTDHGGKVKRFLETGDESLRDAALGAAWTSASAWSWVSASVLDAAWASAWALDAASASVLDAASASVLDAARAAARAAAAASVFEAARAAARAAARNAASEAKDATAAWNAAIKKQRARFNKMVKTAFKEELCHSKK